MDWFSRPDNNEENEERLRDLQFRFGYTKSLEQLEFLESIDNIKEIEKCENLIALEKSKKISIWKKRLEEKYGTEKSLEELAKLERNRLEELVRLEKIRLENTKRKEESKYWTTGEGYNYWKDLLG
jgi:hypothetical protein